MEGVQVDSTAPIQFMLAQEQPECDLASALLPIPADSTRAAPAKIWADAVAAIQAKDPAAMELLFTNFGRGLRLLIGRQVGYQDAEDHVQEVLLVTISAIQKGELRDPECLPGFIRTIARRRIAQQIQKLAWRRSRELDLEPSGELPSTRPNPEQAAIDLESIRIMEAVLKELHPRDREVLERFYLRGEAPEQICFEMNLSDVQFRLLKSRAKARFGEYGRRKLARKEQLPNSRRTICCA